MHVSLRQGEWAFDVPFGPDASIMRLEVLRGPVAQGGKTPSGGYVVNQDACKPGRLPVRLFAKHKEAVHRRGLRRQALQHRLLLRLCDRGSNVGSLPAPSGRN